MPSAPTNVVAERNTDTSISIGWDLPGGTWDSLGLYRWSNVTNSWTSIQSWTGFIPTGYTDTTAAANRRFRYRLRVANSGDPSAWAYSNYSQTTPAPPSGITVVEGTGASVTVSWTNNATTLNGYEYSTLLQEQVDAGAWTTVATLAAGATGEVRTGLTPGSTYQYRVAAQSTVDDVTTSSYSTSTALTITSPPAVPTSLVATFNSNTQATLAWTNHPSTNAPYHRLVAQRLSNISGTWVALATLSGSATGVVDTGLTTNTRYTWRVRAENAAGASAWAVSNPIQTRPDAPTGLVVSRGSGASFVLNWTSQVSYPLSATHTVRYYKNGVLQSDTISIAAGVTTWTLGTVDSTATYAFGVKAVSTVGSTTSSAWVDTATFAASIVPSAPDSLGPNGLAIDLALAQNMSWAHISADHSNQSSYEWAYRVSGASTWITTGQITSTTQGRTITAGTLSNGVSYEWRVRTWGIHATASPWSAVATFSGSATPVVTINEPSATLDNSDLVVEWTYFDTESTTQTAWKVTLVDASGDLLEHREGTDATTSVDMATVIENDATYTLTVTVQDGSGLWSVPEELELTASFTPPAASILTADYDSETGATVLTLTPEAVEPGVTLPAIGAAIQRRMLGDDGEFGPWVTIATGITIDASLFDPIGPTAGDGEYRAITYSDAPSSNVGPSVTPEPETRWLFVSGGPTFSNICRMWGNITLSATASRDRTLYNFAGRSKPVLFMGNATEQAVTVTGLLDFESSQPREWEYLIKTSSVLLLRDPLGRRIYASIDQVNTDLLSNGLYSISFTAREVAYP